MADATREKSRGSPKIKCQRKKLEKIYLLAADVPFVVFVRADLLRM